jgi:heptosyltransferase-3
MRKNITSVAMSYGDYPNLAHVKKVLVVKLRQLGDVLLTSPVFSELKNALPHAHIDAYVYAEAAPLLEGNPSVHALHLYDRKWKKMSLLRRLYEEGKLLRRIRKAGYDLVINLTEGDRGAIAARLSGAKIRVGFDPKGSGLFGKKKFYTHIAKNCPSLRHTVERNLDVLRRIGIFPSQKELFLPILPTALEKMRRIAGEGFILVHPTSRWRFKCWPKMGELCRSLPEKLVFTSGPDPDEIAMVKEICRGLNALDLSGQITLPELFALVQLSGLLICVDSLPLHIASALKKPVVAIFGPTSDITWGPWRNAFAKIVAQNLSCRPCYQDGCGGSKVSDCLATLSVEQVISQLKIISEVALPRAGIRDQLIDSPF